MEIEDWLQKINEEFSRENMPHGKRPFDALARYSKEKAVAVAFGSDLANYIFEWFKKNTKEDAHMVGALYSSTYFYDGEFWDVEIPVFYGTVNFNPFDSLSNMPKPILSRLQSNGDESEAFAFYWSDCFDYGLGVDSILKDPSASEFGKKFLSAGHEEIRSAVSLIRPSRLNPRAILDSRMALEMFFKTYAALKGRLTEDEAKKLGHNLQNGFDKYIELSGNFEFELYREQLEMFPPIAERYQEQEVTKPDLWRAFHLTQKIGAAVVREFGESNIREQVERQMVTSNY